jgi:hypothetical protein
MTTPHKWRFFRAGGFDQVRLDSGADHGKPWDATITRIVDNPISVSQACLAPHKKLVLLWASGGADPYLPQKARRAHFFRVAGATPPHTAEPPGSPLSTSPPSPGITTETGP